MITEGDGSFERRLREGRCPKCTGVLEKEGDVARCRVCSLSIHDASRPSVVPSDEPCKEEEEADEASNHRYAPYDYL